MRRLALILLIGTISTACDLFEADEGPGLYLQVEEPVYPMGDPVRLLLLNMSDSEVVYNLCHARLEKQVQGTWEDVTGDVVCVDVGHVLPPRRIGIERAATDAQNPGRYRYVYEMLEGRGSNELRYWQQVHITLFSDEFEVIDPE